MKIPILQLFLLILPNICIKETKLNTDTRMEGIEPNSGPTTGETRVLVRLRNFDQELIPDYPHPNCRFGSVKYTVNATYVRCAPQPRKVGEREPTQEERTEIFFIISRFILHVQSGAECPLLFFRRLRRPRD